MRGSNEKSHIFIGTCAIETVSLLPSKLSTPRPGIVNDQAVVANLINKWNPLRFNSHHYHAVARHFGGKSSREFAEVFVRPEIANIGRKVRRVTNVRPAH